ncbi:MAG: CoA transferase [Nitrososphaerota archaeon]|nr:CoA transferase [Nitrososphaerota archaeon]
MLQGIRVLEASIAVAGPSASQVLADLGAEVIKVEKPGEGDVFRNTPGMGPTMFLAVNRGKKSVAIDLKTPKGLELFYDLAKKCDVVVENMGPGVAEKLGLSQERVRRQNLKAIYCKVESFGDGPYSNFPAFDPVLQAATGIMSTTGFPPDKYVRAGVSMVDMSTGLHAANAILAQLVERNRSGRGAYIRISLYDAAAYYMSYWVAMYDLYGKDTRPLGTTHIFGSPYNLFRTKDALVYIAIANDKAWQEFCKALGFEDLLATKEYSTSKGRVANKIELESKVARKLTKIPSSRLARLLHDTGVPFAKLNTAKSLLRDPHFIQRGILKKYTYKAKDFRTIVSPAIIEGRRPFASRSPPTVGQDTEKVLRSLLHLKKQQIVKLRSAKIVA